jgi:hypothetical protein
MDDGTIVFIVFSIVCCGAIFIASVIGFSAALLSSHISKLERERNGEK